MRVCITCGAACRPLEMGRARAGRLDPRCKRCISESSAISQNYRRALDWPLDVLKRKIRTTENLLATLRAALEARVS